MFTKVYKFYTLKSDSYVWWPRAVTFSVSLHEKRPCRYTTLNNDKSTLIQRPDVDKRCFNVVTKYVLSDDEFMYEQLNSVH